MSDTSKNNENTQIRISSVSASADGSRRQYASLLTRLDRVFMTLQIHCESLEARFSSRLGKLCRNALANVHETCLNLSRYFGLSPDDLYSGKVLPLALPKDCPRFPALTLPKKPVSGRAKELAMGFCVLENGVTVNVNQMCWSPDPFGVISMSRFEFLYLDWVKELVDAYCITKEDHYLQQAKCLTLRWISECLFMERDPLIWDDHITALRLIVLCQLWAIHRAQKTDTEFDRQLLSAISRHGRRLALSGFYRARHNHGVSQAYALLVVGLLFPALPEASKWADLGRLRLEQQMADNVSPEGMHREHSPYYHFYVFNHFLYAYQFAGAYGIEFSREFFDRLTKMLLCGAYILKPDGTLPSMGDTCKSSPILLRPEDVFDKFAETAQIYLYSFSAGIEGTQPQLSSLILPEAGVALLRSGWGTERPFQHEVFAAVRIRTFDMSHMHHDQGSFELYAYGEDLIVDSGGPYRYGDPLREFFLSTAAHNTVVVDGHNQGIGNAEIVDWRTSSELDLLVMEHRSFPNVDHRRTILFFRPYYLIIIDSLNASAAHAYSQIFHLSPNLAANSEGLTITTTSRSNGPTIKITPLIADDLVVKLHHGTNKPVQGWVCVSEGEKVANTVIEYQRAGSTLEFVVLLIPQAPGVSVPVLARMEVLPRSQGRRILVSRGSCRDEILIYKDQRVTIHSAVGG